MRHWFGFNAHKYWWTVEWRSQNTRLGFPELRLFYPLRNPWCCCTTKEEPSSSLWINKMLLQFHSDKRLLCAPLCQLLADCGWPCLAPEDLVSCHVCTLTGSKVGTEGLRVFDDQWGKTERESPLEEWLSSFLSVSFYLYQFLLLWWRIAASNTEHTES